jgi:hypothetical protein
MIQTRLSLVIVIACGLVGFNSDAVAVLNQCPTQAKTVQTEGGAILKDLYYKATHGQMSREEYNRVRQWQVCLMNAFYNTLRDTPKAQCDSVLQQYRTFAKTPGEFTGTHGTCTPP